MIYYYEEDDEFQEIEVQDVFKEVNENVLDEAFYFYPPYVSINNTGRLTGYTGDSGVCFINKQELKNMIDGLIKIHDQMEDNPKHPSEYDDIQRNL